MAPLPARCSYLIDGVEPCDDWADDGDRCDSHPRRPARSHHHDAPLDDED